MTADTPRVRLGVLGIISVSLFCALFARLWYLQVMAAPDYAVAAAANQSRTVVEPAPRGRILDRNGVVLVDNRISTVLTINSQIFDGLTDDDQIRVVTRVAEEMTRYGRPISPGEVRAEVTSGRYGLTPVPIFEDVPEELAVYISERRAEFTDAVNVEPQAVRRYPYGRLASHALGYVGPLNEVEYEARRRNPLQYQLDDEIGKAGVEASYEEVLRGTPGRRVLEVDAEGNVVRQLSFTPPQQGRDIVLTIDANLQALAEAALADQLGYGSQGPGGSLVVADPRDGQVLAMASYPDYDPSAFTDGISNAEWAALNDPVNRYPLINRAIEGQYAPGSTFKLITAYAAMRSGAIDQTTTISDGGSFTLDNCEGRCTFYNAGRAAHGTVDIRQALTVSSDVFFYQLGARFWLEHDTFGDPIQSAARAFGMGEDTGIELPSERGGLVPDAELKAERHEENPEAFPEGRWRAGDNINLAIGQGDMLVTPLQLANAYATMANGGTVWRPMIVRQILRPGATAIDDVIEPHANNRIELPPEIRQPIIDGLSGVTRHGDGTARRSFRGFSDGFTVAGKTGTAQVSGGREDTSLFVGFGPVDTSQFVVTAILEEAGFGGEAAAPLVRRMFDVLADPALLPQIQNGTGVVLPGPVEGGGVD